MKIKVKTFSGESVFLSEEDYLSQKSFAREDIEDALKDEIDYNKYADRREKSLARKYGKVAKFKDDRRASADDLRYRKYLETGEMPNKFKRRNKIGLGLVGASLGAQTGSLASSLAKNDSVKRQLISSGLGAAAGAALGVYGGHRFNKADEKRMRKAKKHGTYKSDEAYLRYKAGEIGKDQLRKAIKNDYKKKKLADETYGSMSSWD